MIVRYINVHLIIIIIIIARMGVKWLEISDTETCELGGAMMRAKIR